MGRSFKEYKRLNTSDIAFDGNRVWFLRPSIDGLIELDIESGKTDIIYYCDKYYENNWFQSICKCDSAIVMFPSALDEIIVYDIDTKQDQRYFIKKPDSCLIKYDPELKFWNYCVVNKDIYIAGYTYPAIVRLTIKNNEIVFLDSWLESIKGCIIERNYNGYIGYGSTIKNGTIFFPMLCTNALLKVDTNVGKCEVAYIEGVNSGFRTLKEDPTDNSIWLETVDGNIVQLDNALQIRSIIKIPEENSSYYWGGFWPAYITENKVILYPMCAKHGYCIDKTTKRIELCEDKDNYFDEQWFINLIMYKECQDNRFLIHYGDYKWRIIDRNNKILQDGCYYMGMDIIENEIKKCMAEKGIMEEDEDGLELFLGVL